MKQNLILILLLLFSLIELLFVSESSPPPRLLIVFFLADFKYLNPIFNFSSKLFWILLIKFFSTFSIFYYKKKYEYVIKILKQK